MSANSASEQLMTHLLFKSITKEDFRTAEQLIEKGANPNIVLRNGASPFHLLVGVDGDVSENLTRLMLQKGADPNLRSSEGLTPVHIAATYGQPIKLELLLRNGGNPSIKDQEGQTAFDNARISGSDDCQLVLAQYNAEMDITSQDYETKYIITECDISCPDSELDHCSECDRHRLSSGDSFSTRFSFSHASPEYQTPTRRQNRRRDSPEGSIRRSSEQISHQNTRNKSDSKIPTSTGPLSGFDTEADHCLECHAHRLSTGNCTSPRPSSTCTSPDLLKQDSRLVSMLHTDDRWRQSPDGVSNSCLLEQVAQHNLDNIENTSASVVEGKKPRKSFYTGMIQTLLDYINPQTQQLDVTSPDHPIVAYKRDGPDLALVDGHDPESCQCSDSPPNHSGSSGSYRTCSDGHGSVYASDTSHGSLDANDTTVYDEYLHRNQSLLDSSVDDTVLVPRSDSNIRRRSHRHYNTVANNSSSSDGSLADFYFDTSELETDLNNSSFAQGDVCSSYNTREIGQRIVRQLSDFRLDNPARPYYDRDQLEDSLFTLDESCAMSVAPHSSSRFAILSSVPDSNSQLPDSGFHSGRAVPSVIDGPGAQVKMFPSCDAAASACGQNQSRSDFLYDEPSIYSIPSTCLLTGPHSPTATPNTSLISIQTASSKASTCSCRSKSYIYTDLEDKYSLQIESRPTSIVHPCERDESSSTILYDWKDGISQDDTDISGNSCTSVVQSVVIPQEVKQLSNITLKAQLCSFGDDPGPITSTTRGLYEQRLVKLKCDPNLAKVSATTTEFCSEVEQAVKGQLDISQLQDLEDEMLKPFINPDPNRKWREGTMKCSFNYLLLDPRVTQNLPVRAKMLGEKEALMIFLKSIFYVGKGKRSRPYQHFKDSIQFVNNNTQQPSRKVQHILDIWNAGLGVISLHVFQNTIPVEAYSREACLIQALGLSRLTNVMPGNFYGPSATWSRRQRKFAGISMLRKALRILLSEGERQIRPADVKVGS